MAYSIKKNAKTGRWEVKDGRTVISTHKYKKYATSKVSRLPAKPKRKRGPTRTKAKRISSSGSGTRKGAKSRKGTNKGAAVTDRSGKRIGSVHPVHIKLKGAKTRVLRWRARTASGKTIGQHPATKKKNAIARVANASGFRNRR